MPTLRRRPWGQLWAAAPWDGRAKPPEPFRMPNTAAAPIDTPSPRGAVSLRRQGFGRMLAAVPWAGPSVPVPEVARTDGRIDFDAPSGSDDETVPNTLSARARRHEARP